MQGISKTNHERLIRALFQLEGILGEEDANAEGLAETVQYRQELEAIMQYYERLLAELAKHIVNYHHVYHNAKMKFLGPKLKELKKGIMADKVVYSLLCQNIHLVYGS